MIRRITRLALSICGVTLLGCSDAVTPAIISGPIPGRDLDVFIPFTATVRSEVPPPVDPGGDSGPSWSASDEIPSEYYVPASVKNTRLGAVFFEGKAHAPAESDIFGTHRKQTSKLSLRWGTTPLGSAEDFDEKNGTWPFSHRMVTNASMALGRPCGHIIDASATYRAEIKWEVSGETLFISGDGMGANKSASQEPCVEGPVGGGGGGSDGGIGGSPGYTCYFYYVYYKDTGEIIYSEFLGCW